MSGQIKAQEWQHPARRGAPTTEISKSENDDPLSSINPKPRVPMIFDYRFCTVWTLSRPQLACPASKGFFAEIASVTNSKKARMRETDFRSG